jgi:hypothetical protein
MMAAEFWQWVGQILTLLGGVGVVAAFVAKFFADRSNERYKAELGRETERLKAELGKDAETHKWKLKKKEILFQKEFEAALDFFALRRRIEPRFRHPDMEWHEAMRDVIERFSTSEKSTERVHREAWPGASSKNS